MFVPTRALAFVIVARFVVVPVTVFVDSGPVFVIVPVCAAASPVVRLRPKTVVAAARISCFFIRTSLID